MGASDEFTIGGSLGGRALLFLAVFTIEGLIRPDYDASSMFVSELSLGPRGWIQILNFIVFGFLLLLFARGVAAEFGKTARLGLILLTIIGFSFLMSGPFMMHPRTVPLAEMSITSLLHYLFGALVFSLSPISCFLFAHRFSKDSYWRPLVWWSFLIGVLLVVAVVLLKAATTLASDPANEFNKRVGAIQRLALVPYLCWIFIFAWRLSGKKSFRRKAVQADGAQSRSIKFSPSQSQTWRRLAPPWELYLPRGSSVTRRRGQPMTAFGDLRALSFLIRMATI